MVDIIFHGWEDVDAHSAFAWAAMSELLRKRTDVSFEAIYSSPKRPSREGRQRYYVEVRFTPDVDPEFLEAICGQIHSLPVDRELDIELVQITSFIPAAKKSEDADDWSRRASQAVLSAAKAMPPSNDPFPGEEGGCVHDGRL